MMDDLDLFNRDLDLNLDLGIDAHSSTPPDFLPEDLFKYTFTDDELKAITENDAIPDIENLINFDEDDQLDDIQWDQLDLDTVDFLDQIEEEQEFNNFQIEQQHYEQQQKLNVEETEKKLLKSSNKNKTIKKNRQNKTNNKQNSNNKKNKNQLNDDELELTRSIESIAMSPSISSIYSTENSNLSSNDSSIDFLDMFPTNYYSLDDNNNLISHPISEIPIDELNKINSQLPYSFDLSNNFGGFANVQSVLSMVNGASSSNQFTQQQHLNTTIQPLIQQQPKLMTNKQFKKNKSKGTSLLANKPKSYKTIKREMLQKKSNNLNKMTINKLKSASTLTTSDIELEQQNCISISTTTKAPSMPIINLSKLTFETNNDDKINDTLNTAINTTINTIDDLDDNISIKTETIETIETTIISINRISYEQDHDYCFNILNDDFSNST